MNSYWLLQGHRLLSKLSPAQIQATMQGMHWGMLGLIFLCAWLVSFGGCIFELARWRFGPTLRWVRLGGWTLAFVVLTWILFIDPMHRFPNILTSWPVIVSIIGIALMIGCGSLVWAKETSISSYAKPAKKHKHKQ